jgi:hypothetical protein
VVPTAVTVASGGSLDINAASSESVTFAGGTGSLILDQPAGFTGHIIGFTGTAPDAAHSDTIDLVGIDFNSSQFAESYNSSTGLLTVTDGTHNASFTFDNFAATLVFASDSKGGTLIADPPASGGSGAAVTAPAELGIKFVHDEIGAVTAQSNDKSAAAIALDGAKATLVSLPSGDNFIFKEALETNSNANPNSHDHADEFNDHHDTQSALALAAPLPSGDNFVFKQALETNSNANANSHDHANEFNDHHDAQSAHALAAPPGLDPHTEATFGFTHNDALTAQMHQMIQAGHALLQ